MDEEIITLGRFKDNFNKLMNNTRSIFYNNSSFFTFVFLILYTIEQALLIWFSIKLSPDLALGISFFVLIMMATISIERLLMESKYNNLLKYNSNLRNNYRSLLRKYTKTKHSKQH